MVVLQRVITALLITLVILSGPGATSSASPQAQDAPEPVLYLQGEHDGTGSYRNFTTRAPTQETGVGVEPCQVAQEGRAEWCWQTDRSPAPWTLEAGSRPHAVIHLGNLQRVPLAAPHDEDPRRTGQPRIDVILTRGTHHEVARGHAYIQAPLLSGNETATVHVDLVVDKDTHWNITPGDAPAVELKIHLTGLVRRDEPPHVITESGPAPSHIVLPGFPVAAFTAWEAQEHQENQCYDRLITQRSCEAEEDRSLDPDTVQEAGAALTVPFAAFALCIALFVRRHSWASLEG